MAVAPPPDASALVFRRELRASVRTWLWWTAPVTAMVAMTCALQPSLAAGPLAAKLDSMPPLLRKAFGIEALDFHRPVAYLATNFTIVALATSLFASQLAASLIAKEETLRTAELLYTVPASRTRILTGKLGALAVYTLALPTVLAVVALAVLGAVAEQPLEPGAIIGLFVGAGAVALCFAGVGLLAATLVRDKRAAGGVALGTVMGTYFLGIISAIAEAAAPLRWLSPHKLAEATGYLRHGLQVKQLVLLVAIGGLSATLAVARYRRHDIHA
jgi:ABC-2 type transport system permease protein